MTITVEDVIPRVQYVATSGQAAFDVPFTMREAASESDVQVYQNGTLLDDADWTLTLDADPSDGGTCTLDTGATLSDVITLIRNTTISRTTNFTASGEWTASNVNLEFNTLHLILQEVDSKVDRSFYLDDSYDETGGAVSLSITPEADKVPMWNSTATALVNSTQSLGTIESNMASLVAAIPTISTLGGLTTEIAALGAITADITTVAGIESDITTVAAAAGDINTLADAAEDTALFYAAMLGGY